MTRGRRTNLRDDAPKDSAWRKRLFSGYAITLGVAGLLAAVGVAATSLWGYVRPRVVNSEQYRLQPQDIFVTQQPSWIKAPVDEEVIRSAGLDDEPSILDERLAPRISRAFSAHPWVAKVINVSVRHPARVDVELVYRRPVCMVELPRAPSASDGGLYPVDAGGVILPSSDFSALEASVYPRVESIRSFPGGNVGQPWGDPRVEGAAALAALISDDWRKLGLDRIVPSLDPTGPTGGHEYELFTRRGRRVIWGVAPLGAAGPLSAPPKEPAAAEKLQRLKQVAAEFGNLDAQDAPHEIDLRSVPEPRTAARPKGE